MARVDAELRRGLIDTSTFILMPYLDEEEIPDLPFISAITLAELSVGPLIAETDDEREIRLGQVQAAEADFDPLPFDGDAARAFARVAASLRRCGRKVDARAYDALIAAIAIANGLALYTCNPDDFDGIDGLDVVPIPHPDSQR